MNIQEISNKETWENFLAKCNEKTFMQSWNWGEFQKRMGNTIWRIGALEGEALQGIMLVIKVSAKRGTFLLVQHTIPVAQNVFQLFLEHIQEIAKHEGASFMRIAPLWERNEKNEQFFRELGFRQAPLHANAYEATWKLDIAKPEEELFGDMRKTTRYLIRQTQKNQDIEISRSEKREDLEFFDILNKEMGRRQQFVPFSKQYMESEFDAFAKDNAVSLFLGKYKGEMAAAALVVFWSGIGFYHQAASKGEYAKFSIPYLLQWEVIKEAKRRGCKLYDFWGYVDPKKYPNHPWAGPTLFKMGFGGKPYEYVKTQDYPLSWKYWPIAMFETIRKKRRGL